MRTKVIPGWVGGIAIAALAMVFVLTPDGWNLIPMILLALVALLTIPFQRPAQELSESSDAPPDATDTGSNPPSNPADSAPKPRMGRRLNRAFGPVIAGLIIDLLDLATFGPIGMYLGFPIGALAGYWMGRALGGSRRMAAMLAVAAGVYCMLPGTEFIPLATLFGALVRFYDHGPAQRK
ncbi:MAG: hypothetical protein KBA51_02725 [Kiritimatiellae bacterium]|nr:hypothetical protein [Kiritimatiellia bacterium]